MTTSDLIIIGAGPGGYETAIEAAKAGLTVTLIEAKHLGGTCLNEGASPQNAWHTVQSTCVRRKTRLT